MQPNTPDATHEVPSAAARDIEANTQAYNHAIESMARQYPEQWFWVHQRWKTRPYQAWPRANEKK